METTGHDFLQSSAINVNAAINLRDKAEARATYARARGLREATDFYKEVQLRAERKAGEFLRQDAELGSGKNPRWVF